MNKSSDPKVVADAPPEQIIGKPQVSSNDRGKPVDRILARMEARFPGIEEKIGLSSAAVRAGRLVREMRQAKGWTQVRLAKELGWDQVRISNIERGEGTRGPTFDVLQKIAAACDYDIEFKPRQAAASVGYLDILDQFTELFPHAVVLPGTMLPDPQFAAACVSFAGSLGSAVRTYFRTVEEPLPSASTAKGQMERITYVEMVTKGKRMLMLPVMVKDDGSQTKTGELEVKLSYPHRPLDFPAG
jgi:transcriptional regulator with XRE-family HTH domain